MIGPTSIFNSSPSSSLARSFVKLLGVTPSQVGMIKKSPVRSAVEDAYTEKVREYARARDGWDVLADFLYVVISEDDGISIEFSGSDDDRLLMEALEYGTPGNPPSSVIRVMEEDLRQDYVLTKKRFAA